VKDLKEGTKEGEPFLSMHELGPFNVKNIGHMKKFEQTILAFNLQMSSLRRERFDQKNSGTTSVRLEQCTLGIQELIASMKKTTPKGGNVDHMHITDLV
jgi:hypothetical protein